MEQDNKLKEAVTLLISSHNVNSLAARSTSENFQRQKILILQILGRMMGRMKDGIRLISMKCLVSTAGKPEDDPMMGLVLKNVSESCNQANENWGEPASEEVTKVIQLPIQENLSETTPKSLLTNVTLLRICRFALTKLLNPLVFASICSSIRSTKNKTQKRSTHYVKNDYLFLK